VLARNQKQAQSLRMTNNKTDQELIAIAIANVMDGSNEAQIQNVYAEIEKRGLDALLDSQLETLDLGV